MTFENFGLNPDCNAYQDEKAADIKNGVEYAKATIHDTDNIAVFVVDALGRTVCVYKEEDSDNIHVSKKYDTGVYWDSRIKAYRKSDCEIIGSWMMDYMSKLNVAKYGVIVENPDGSFQVLK